MKKENNPPCDLCKKNGLPNCGRPWCYTNIETFQAVVDYVHCNDGYSNVQEFVECLTERLFDSTTSVVNNCNERTKKN